MSKVKIVGHGSKTEIWVDGRMISNDVVSFNLSQEAGFPPKLEVVHEYYVSELEVEEDTVDIESTRPSEDL